MQDPRPCGFLQKVPEHHCGEFDLEKYTTVGSWVVGGIIWISNMAVQQEKPKQPLNLHLLTNLHMLPLRNTIKSSF